MMMMMMMMMMAKWTKVRNVSASSEEIDIIDYSMHQFIAKYEARNLMASDDSSLSSMKLAIPWAVATVMLMLRKFPGLRRPP